MLLDRYERNYGTLTEEGQELINKKSVLIIGAGGLGGFVVEGLARMGVKNLGICDFDVFVASNLNRQIYSSVDVLGEKKVDIVKKRISRIDPTIKVHTYEERFPNKKLDSEIEMYDIVIDCLDNIETRLLLEGYCIDKNIKLVHGAVGGYYGTVALITNENRINQKLMNSNVNKEKTIDKMLGNPYSIVAIIGSLQVHLAIRVLLGKTYLKKGFYYIDIENIIIEEIVI